MKTDELIKELQDAQKKGGTDKLNVFFCVGDDVVPSWATRVTYVTFTDACYIDIGCQINTEVEVRS